MTRNVSLKRNHWFLNCATEIFDRFLDIDGYVCQAAEEFGHVSFFGYMVQMFCDVVSHHVLRALGEPEHSPWGLHDIERTTQF